jgi:hypothetical protein
VNENGALPFGCGRDDGIGKGKWKSGLDPGGRQETRFVEGPNDLGRQLFDQHIPAIRLFLAVFPPRCVIDFKKNRFSDLLCPESQLLKPYPGLSVLNESGLVVREADCPTRTKKTRY